MWATHDFNVLLPPPQIFNLVGSLETRYLTPDTWAGVVGSLNANVHIVHEVI